MMFRSSTRVAKTVERYAAFIPVYMPTAIDPASVTQRNIRSSRLGSSPGARNSDVSPAMSGITPSPIASDPAAQLPTR